MHSLITSDSFSASLKWRFSGQLVFTFLSLRSLHGTSMELIFIPREPDDHNLTGASLLHCLIASQRTMYIRRCIYKYPSIDHKLLSRELAICELIRESLRLDIVQFSIIAIQSQQIRVSSCFNELTILHTSTTTKFRSYWGKSHWQKRRSLTKPDPRAS